MGLSFNKLQEYIKSQNYTILNIFLFEKRIFFIELYNSDTGVSLLLYIPSKYKFSLSEGSNVYKLKFVELKYKKTIEEYTNVKQEDVEEVYGDEEIEIAPGDNEDIENHLEEKYKKHITVKDIGKDDIKDINSIARQVQRLSYNVFNITYKIGIQYKNYIVYVRRSNDIEMFQIKHFPKKIEKKLFVIIDLEIFFEAREKVTMNVENVRNSIYKILDKNQRGNVNAMKSILENKTNFLNCSYDKTEQINMQIGKLEDMIATLSSRLTEIFDKINGIDRNTGNDNDTSLKSAHLNEEYRKIYTLREETLKTLLELRMKKENLILCIDKILFDNTVIINSMLKNFAQLQELIE